MAISQWLQFPEKLFFRREDERIYALMRIAFAIVALINLIMLWPDRQQFLTDSGMVDQEVAMRLANPVYVSVFQFARSEAAVSGLMIFTGVALVALMAGVGARLAALWAVVWHISFVARAPLPLGGWDTILRNFSFLILISPLGECWTLPALLRGSAKRAVPGVSAHGLVLMRLQVLVIYWHAELARLLSHDPYWKNGEFLSYFMLSHYARWPGRWVLQYEGLMILGTFGVQLAETAIPVLLWFRRTRWWGVLLGFALHAGISVAARGFVMFCLAMLMTYIAFLRKEDMDGLVHCWRGRFRPVAAPQQDMAGR